MTICHLRDLHECGCAAGQCVAAPPQIDIIDPPFIRFTAREQMILTLIACAIIPIGIFIGASMADPVIHREILAEQENVRHG